MNDACETKKVVLTDDKYSKVDECLQNIKDTSQRIENEAAAKADALHGASPNCASSEKSPCGEGWLAVVLFSLNLIKENLDATESSLSQI
jgi:hypothetical protein